MSKKRLEFRPVVFMPFDQFEKMEKLAKKHDRQFDTLRGFGGSEVAKDTDLIEQNDHILNASTLPEKPVDSIEQSSEIPIKKNRKSKKPQKPFYFIGHWFKP